MKDDEIGEIIKSKNEIQIYIDHYLSYIDILENHILMRKKQAEQLIKQRDEKILTMKAAELSKI